MAYKPFAGQSYSTRPISYDYKLEQSYYLNEAGEVLQLLPGMLELIMEWKARRLTTSSGSRREGVAMKWGVREEGDQGQDLKIRFKNMKNISKARLSLNVGIPPF